MPNSVQIVQINPSLESESQGLFDSHSGSYFLTLLFSYVWKYSFFSSADFFFFSAGLVTPEIKCHIFPVKRKNDPLIQNESSFFQKQSDAIFLREKTH